MLVDPSNSSTSDMLKQLNLKGLKYPSGVNNVTQLETYYLKLPNSLLDTIP